ncbi:MAG: RagB/SusD family nutrient uptake outer membrane protein [Niabella sp.]|nr:MAG: RagB/SusD family nutrient uptake outer membrane protein [Niabella sp.]
MILTINKFRTGLYLGGVALLLLTLPSCKKFLEEKPSKSTALVVSTTDQLEALLSNYATFYQEGNRTAVYSSDNSDLPIDLYKARPGTFSMAVVEFSIWDSKYLANDGREGFWSGEFRKIFNANMVLGNLDRVTGSPEAKAALKAEAHFIRAYSYFQLANTYCLPFNDANKDAQGLPIKQTTSFEEPVKRAKLSEVYDLIDADLKEALKLNKQLVQNGKPRNWRANTAAINGFAARYYLQSNNYNEALSYANKALTEYNVLVDYNTDMRYGRTSTVTIDGGTPNAQSVTLQFPYTHDNQSDLTDMIGWKELMYFRMLNNESWWYIPSADLLSLYDVNNDLRYKYHIVKNYSYDRGLIKPSYSYPGYIFFFKDRLPSGPTTAEMYLIKAECLARNNDVANAMQAVNTLHKKRVVTGSPDLQANTKETALRVILEERRREMPFTMRWFDIRRFNHNEDATDNVVMKRTFFPYTSSAVQMTESPVQYSLEPNSKRYAAPIPQVDIISSQGVLEQNNY